MTRPGIVSIVSAIAASSAAFFVVSRGQLLGTVAGAAVISAVYTLVSHYSSESLERGGLWLWRHVRRRPGGAADETAGAEQDSLENASREQTSTEGQARSSGQAHSLESGRPRTALGTRAGSRMQWSLGAFALLAFGFSIYALSASGTIEKTIVEQRVIEKTVTVTSEVITEIVTEVAQAPAGGSAAPGAAVTGEQTVAPTTDTTSGSQDAAAQPVSTVTTAEEGAEEQHTTSTTQGAVTTSTSASAATTTTEPAQPDVP